MRLFGYLILFALIGYGIWPYYSVYRLDEAINQAGHDPTRHLVDLPAIRANYKKRVSRRRRRHSSRRAIRMAS